MSLCVNPHCQNPQNPDNLLFCQHCGSELLLQGRYRIVKQLGKGGFGKTYEVSEARSNTLKVLKVLVNTQTKAVELFKQEADVLKLLDHPGIPKVESDGYFEYLPKNWSTPLHCLVMEKIEGLDLQEYLTQRGNRPIDQKLALRWLTDIVNILQQVHQHNFFHRDLKPSNIMLRSDGCLALIDFGTVRAITATYMAKQPVGQVTGIYSPGYTPSEQINYQAVPQSDFFALGRTFIFLLTGKQPTDPDIYDFQNDTLNWRGFAPHIAPQLADFIDQMMARLPNQRPADTQFILRNLTDIEQALYPPQVSKPPQNSPPQVQAPVTPTTEFTRRRFTKWLGFGGIGLAGAGLISVLFDKKKSTLTVSRLGSGDYKTIREAIANADPGTSILVQPGHYPESIIINKPLKIIGNGSKADILIESTDSNCISMKTDYAEVTGLTLHGQGRLNYYAVDISQGELLLTDCDITSDPFCCIGIYGATAKPVIRNCQIHDAKGGAGIVVEKKGQGIVENCDIFGNAFAGVEIREDGNPVVKNCRIHHGKEVGIYVHNNGQGTVEDCDISDNAYSGVTIQEGGNPIIRQSRINRNIYNAVYAHDKANGTIENCNVTGNLRTAFNIDTTSQVQLNGNTQ